MKNIAMALLVMVSLLSASAMAADNPCCGDSKPCCEKKAECCK